MQALYLLGAVSHFAPSVPAIPAGAAIRCGTRRPGAIPASRASGFVGLVLQGGLPKSCQRSRLPADVAADPCATSALEIQYVVIGWR